MTTRDVYDSHLRNKLDDDLQAARSAHDLDGTDVLDPVPGNVLYLTSRAHRDGTDELTGTDTFVIHDDLIHMHTFHGTTPTVDDGS
jgi:hypothetical protein